MTRFIGRDHELAELRRLWHGVASARGTASPGHCVVLRGSRRVGKTRLAEVFVTSAGSPALFYAAARGGGGADDFVAQLRRSPLDGRGAGDETIGPKDWAGALDALALALPEDRVSIVVLDEFSRLLRSDPGLEAVFERAWVTRLSAKPVLLVLIGSEAHAMESLNAYGHAFYQRGTEIVLHPLDPLATGELVGARGAAAFDAFLVTGGLPLVCDEWTKGQNLHRYLADALSNSSSALVTSGERILEEIGHQSVARRVLRVIGTDERTFTNIARAAGGLTGTSLTRALDELRSAHLVSRDQPFSLRRPSDTRYSVTDPFLRFWLRFVEPHLADIDRGRGDLLVAHVDADWLTWRGRSIEPVVRDALGRLLPARGLPGVGALGAYWTRTNSVEVDIVGVDEVPYPREVLLVGSIKWRERAHFHLRDLDDLKRASRLVPGVRARTPLVAVSRNGFSSRLDAVTFDASDLLDAWR